MEVHVGPRMDAGSDVDLRVVSSERRETGGLERSLEPQQGGWYRLVRLCDGVGDFDLGRRLAIALVFPP
ncbi:MAG: hypothetical protein WBP56_18365 [Polyangia bacterium]